MKLVELALLEFRANGLDSLDYQVSVYRTKNGHVAVFEYANVDPGKRGSPPSMPSFEVEFNESHEMIRSSFVR